MAEDLNFLPEQTADDKQKINQQKKTNFFSIIFLLVMMALLIGLSGYWLILTAATRSADAQADEIEKQITTEHEKEIIRKALVDKLVTSESILSSATPFSVALEKVTAVLAAKNIPLKDSSLKADKNLTFSMDFSNSVDFQAVLEALTGADLSSDFGSARLSSFKKDSAATPYVFTIEVKFLKKGTEGMPKK